MENLIRQKLQELEQLRHNLLQCLFGGGALEAKIADLGFSQSHFFAS
ncbi:MAG: hypothetical protein H6559_00885 [Lewinellaceae bacterium]|nr:hypothetical protein [Lewinellaceae bacterium]